MDLFLVRHATAVPGSDELRDPDRPLTGDGRKKFQRVVRGLRRLGITLDHVYHSPWRRAVETADELAPLGGRRVVCDHLADAPTSSLLDVVKGRCVALVGHEPWMSELCAWLVVGDTHADRGFLFKKGGVAWLSGDPRPGRMMLVGLFPPRVLRTLGAE